MFEKCANRSSICKNFCWQILIFSSEQCLAYKPSVFLSIRKSVMCMVSKKMQPITRNHLCLTNQDTSIVGTLVYGPIFISLKP